MSLATALVMALVMAQVMPTAALAQAAAPAPSPPPVERFFEPESTSGAQLSPDGRLLALRLVAPGRPARLGVLDLQTREPRVAAAFDDAAINSLRWVNDRRLVFDLATELVGPGRVDRGPGLFAVDADGTRLRQLVQTELAFVRQPELGVPLLHWRYRLLAGQAPQPGDEVLVVAPEEVSSERTGHYQLQRLDTRSGRAEPVDAPSHAVDWIVDEHAALRLVTRRQGSEVSVAWRDAAGSWQTLGRFDALAADAWAPRLITPDGRLYVQARHGDKTALFTLDPASGRRADKPLVAAPDFDVDAGFVVGQGRLLGVRHVVDAEVTTWLDADSRALQARVDALLPATANRLSLPRHGDSPWVLVEAFADVQPTLTLLFHRGSGQLSRVGAARPGIDPAQMGLTDFVRYKAGDGLEIPAYLTLPPGQRLDGKKKLLPMVVLVHGGPWVRGAQWQWQAEVQFLASRGYAVLQPEFRGSTGFGHAHFKAGWRQWGQAMQTDLADGARWAIAQGIADPKRIAIAGASYGGYATLMGLAKNPELFRAGVSWAGVSDPRLLFSVYWSDINQESLRHGYARLLGDPQVDAAMFETISPLGQARRIRQPLLLAHGGWDQRVPLVHAEAVRAAIQPPADQLDWVVYPDEGHGWQKPATQVDFWRRVERFLARHLAPD